VLSGEPGIGKTELWLEGVHRAADRGIRVLQARPAEPERQLSFASLGDLLGDAITDVAGSLPEPQREALLAALLRSPSPATVDPRTTATALTSVLWRLAAERPVIVAIDDVQWLDRASSRALDFALRRLPRQAGVLLAVRARHGRSPLGLDEALGREAVTQVAVGPLSVEALHRVLATAGFEPSRSTLTRLAAASGGNPFYALELARALGAADAEPGEPLPVPTVLAELVRERLHRLSPAAHAAVTVASASFRPTPAAIAAALDADADVDAAVVEAEEAGVVEWDGDRLRFTHPLLGSALYGGLSVGRRRALHRRIAAAVTDPEERAHHLVGGTVGTDAHAAGAVEEAAGLAAGRGAADAAAELFQVAERMTPRSDAEARARRSLGAAHALATAGDLPAARALAKTARALATTGAIRSRALLLEGSIATYMGLPDEQSAALDAALAEAGEDPAARLEVLVALAGRIGIEPAGAARSADEAVRLSREMGDSASLAKALMHLVVASGILGLGLRQDLFDEAAELETAQPTFGIDSLIWCHWVDDVPGARARYAQQRRLAHDRGDDFAAAELAEFVAMVDFRTGDWDAAEQALEGACTTFAQFPVAGPVTASFADRSVVDAHRGRLERARQTLRDILEGEIPPDPFWGAVCLSARGAVEFVAGDLRAAHEAWTSMRKAAASVGWVDFLEDRSEPDHIETLLALGEVGRASELLAHLEWRGRTLPRPWIDATLPRAKALVSAAEGELDAALELLDAAADKDELPFERARLLIVRGQLERRANRKLAARQSLEAALQIFAGLGSPPWIERTRAEIGRLGLRHRDRHELTAMERRIAELAATGLTNRQVADAAFVSPKTVEANLARVYGKLGIRSRAELGARMAGVAGSPDVQT
jgi:DNA-binding CsgD family transcriptional regulator